MSETISPNGREPYASVPLWLLSRLTGALFTGAEFAVGLAIASSVYRFRRDAGAPQPLSIDQLARATQRRRSTVADALNRLADAGLIMVTKGHGRVPSLIGFCPPFVPPGLPENPGFHTAAAVQNGVPPTPPLREAFTKQGEPPQPPQRGGRRRANSSNGTGKLTPEYRAELGELGAKSPAIEVGQ